MNRNNAKRSRLGQEAVLGLMPPLTGVVGIYGAEITRAAQIATLEVNEQGGVLGKPLRLVIEDDGSLPHSAVMAAERLIDHHGCAAIIGNLLSNSRIAVTYRVAEPRKIPLLNYSFYEGSILSRYFFHFAALPNQQIGRMIPYMREQYGNKMFFAGNNYEWPRGSIDAAKEVLLQQGGQVVGEEYLPIGVSSCSIDDLLQQVVDSGADVFVPYFAGADQLLLLTRFSVLDLKKRMVVVTGHYDEILASHLPPEVRDGYYSSNTYFMTVGTESNRCFLDRLSAMPNVTGIWPRGNGIVTNFGEGAYLCVKAFAQAANLAGTLDTKELVRALETISVTGPQGTVDMDPATHHAKVNTFLSRCNSEGQFDIVAGFGAIDPVMPERYSHLRIDARAAREEDIRLQARMLEHMTEGVCLVRALDGLVVYANRGFEKMFAYDQHEIMGQAITVTCASTDQIQGIFDHLYRKGFWKGELRNVRKDGTLFWVHVSITTLTHAEFGEVWMAIYQDISMRKQAEEELHQYRDNLEEMVRLRTEELERARDAAEAGARAKETFLVNMSHEIRTPMNGVLGMAELLSRTILTEQQRHYVATIQRSGHTLLRIINDILDFAKIQDGRLPLEILRFDLDVVMSDVCYIFTQRAMQKNLEFRFNRVTDSAYHLLGDPYRLSQILFNLLGNAVKFTDQGSVHLSLEVAEEQAADILLRFCVTDTGIGISPDYQNQMCQNFSQEDASITRRFGGTGLGLAITRQLVSVMGGHLWVESTPGQGSSFWFTARFGKQQPGDRKEIAAWQREEIAVAPDTLCFRGHVLLVEDNVVNQEVAKTTLELLGCCVTVATDGQQALSLVCGQEPPFDAVFMDCEMPVLDGFTTTMRLRQWERQSGKIPVPVIALTAHVLQESRQRCTEAGMNDYLHKPFSQADMANVLRRWLSTSPVASDRSDEPSGEVLDPVALGRILELTRKSGAGLLIKMVGHYLSRTPELLATLRQALDCNDPEGVRIAAHTLKSSSLTMGVVQLAELGRVMEAGHADLALVGRLLQGSDALFAEAKQALNALCAEQQTGESHE
ncbi:MAG: ABC transporter substrate-binding protein [Magnetococcales bacterium]|nr:ABC transporter substrate-binding protein [Magnetococcales bacterium]